MQFREWAPEYRRILREMGFAPEADSRSAEALARLLKGSSRAWGAGAARGRLAKLMRGRPVLVVGAGPGPLPLPLPDTLLRSGPWVVIAADGATTRCLKAGTVPDLVVTDLDGDLPDEVEANRLGAVVVVHAHGDNLPTLRSWVGRFPGPLVGSCAAKPPKELINPGGFTDGDRAVYLAEAMGARRALLCGFDLVEPYREPRATRWRKRAKLAVARRLLDQVAARGRLSLEVYGSDRRPHPWMAQGLPQRRRIAAR